MATRVVDERKLLDAGFTLEARNLVRGESLWSRADTPHRSYLDSEAVRWLAEQEAKGKKKR